MTLRIAFAYHFNDRSWLGGKNYFASLFSAIQCVAPNEVELMLVTGRKTETTLPQEFPCLNVVRTSLLDRLHPLWGLRQLARLPSSRRHDPIFGRFLQRLGVNVLSHSEALLAAGSDVKALGWLPDFQFMHMPQMWSSQELARMQRGCENVCRGSDALVVSSRAALADLDSFAPWYGKPKHVLHFVSSSFTTSAFRSVEELCVQYSLPQTYFHLPNQFWTHKNHQVVVEALALLKADGVAATVACTGSTSDPRKPDHYERLIAQSRAAGVENEFKVLGVVPYADMQALMSHAHAVVNPSRFEGWSTTVEEAKTMGKLILLSDIAVHREQDPTHAVYFPVDDPRALANAMNEALRLPRIEAGETSLLESHTQRLRSFGASYMKIVRSL
jgi:glycosyltransferase involved in cell wall biosynthesis